MKFGRVRFLSLATLVGIFGLLATPTAPAAGNKRVIQQLTSIFENSTTDFQYTYCANIGDQRGWTFGFVGFTSGTYSGTFFLEEYRRLRPRNRLNQFLSAFRRIDAGPHDAEGRNPDTTGLEDFPAVFQSLGSDPKFRRAQHNLVNRLSWNPSRTIARRLGSRWPLTRGQLYDSYVNHGESGIRKLIRRTNRRAGGQPGSGIPERLWLETFLQTRLRVLRADPVWTLAVDRIAVYQTLLRNRNTSLKTPFPVTCYGNSFVID